jgi:hypothetical protein
MVKLSEMFTAAASHEVTAKVKKMHMNAPMKRQQHYKYFILYLTAL